VTLINRIKMMLGIKDAALDARIDDVTEQHQKLRAESRELRTALRAAAEPLEHMFIDLANRRAGAIQTSRQWHNEK
jgi:hypothetical protein